MTKIKVRKQIMRLSEEIAFQAENKHEKVLRQEGP